MTRSKFYISLTTGCSYVADTMWVGTEKREGIATFSIVKKARDIRFALKSFLIGATTYHMIRRLAEERLLAEHVLMISVLGDQMGYPVSSYYRLRLLPYWMMRLDAWKRSLLRERDAFERLL